MSAEERRDQVVKAAVAEFAVRGLEGTSTGDIAKRVGVSQPYLFRLFPTKRDLFIAAVDHSAAQVRDVFTKAADGKYGAEAMAAMGEAYQDLLLADDELLGMQLQQFAACHDPEVQAAVRGVMQGIWHHVENLTGAPVENRVDFFAKGMLCNMIAAMGRADGGDPMWQPVLDVLRDEVKPPRCEPYDETAEVRAGSPRESGYAAYVERSLTK
ncbi:TetR/AcrR family transcriptional regulator [Catenulispora subtropica]|uniref:TetR family transcriptional regulator n=1 Tax=Catenulispora subtropica TaxID=450798 RepID=A0ABN2R464_9ACTN